MPEPALLKLKEFFQSGTLLRYGKGAVLLHAGEAPKGIYFIDRGHVKIYSIRNTGELNLHVIYGANDLFPLTWAYRGVTTNVFYEAMDNVAVWLCPADEFRALVFGDLAVAKLMLEQLSEVHWSYANRIENLELGRAYDRVVFRLLDLAYHSGRENSVGETVIQAPITQQDIADSLNMIRETASREIERLEHKGLVAYRRHRIVITDIVKLRQEMAKLH